jgi:hypothetical protein
MRNRVDTPDKTVDSPHGGSDSLAPCRRLLGGPGRARPPGGRLAVGRGGKSVEAFDGGLLVSGRTGVGGRLTGDCKLVACTRGGALT